MEHRIYCNKMNKVNIISSDEESIVLDSDEDISEIRAPWQRKLVGITDKKTRPFIIETDDEEEVILSDDEISDGRLTPSIHKAIRQSIFNISQHEIIDDTNSSRSSIASAEEESSAIDDTNERITRLSLGHSSAKEGDRRNSYADLLHGNSKTEISDDDDNIGNSTQKSPLSSKKLEAIEAKVFSNKNHQMNNISKYVDEIHEVDSSRSSNKSLEIVNIDSDTSGPLKENQNLSEAVSLAGHELNNLGLNSMVAQKRASIISEIQKIENEKRKINIFLKEGNLQLLPDKGEKLRINIAKHDKKLKELQAELNTIPLVHIDQLDEEMHSSASQIRNRFREEFDITNMLKPTANVNTNEFGKKALETFQREQALTVDRLEDLHGSLLSRPADDECAEDPRGLRIKLMPHQQHALAWLLWREQQKPPGGVLADDMGLGKTLTMISLIMASLAQDKNDNIDDEDWIQKDRLLKYKGGTLVVCPASLVSQWQCEIESRCKRGSLIVELYHGNNRETQARRLARNDVVVTSYNLLSREFKKKGVIYHIDWKRVILDESHVIRNHKSQVCESVCEISARKRWAMTGTPIHNKEMDIYAILKFLKCSPFDDLRVWKRWVDNKNSAGHERLAAVMKSLMLRRTKHELMKKGSLNSLPNKSLEIINVDLDLEERLIYEKVLVYSKTLFAQFLAQRAEKKHNFELGADIFKKRCCKTTQFNIAQQELLARHADVKQFEILLLLLRLRQLCCHPSLLHAMLDRDDLEVNGLEDTSKSHDVTTLMENLKLNSNNNDRTDAAEDIGIDKRVAEHLLTSDNPVFDRDRKSSKLRSILQLTEEILQKRNKVIIVSQWTKYLEIIAENLNSIKGAAYKMFTGAVPVKHRQEIVESFNKKGNDPQILLLSLTAGGVGLNLVAANHLMLIDIHWNPQLESQAQDRIYRFGQNKDVFIYKFICSDTIEERIKNLQEKKLEIASAVLTGTSKNSTSKLTLADLRSLFNL